MGRSRKSRRRAKRIYLGAGAAVVALGVVVAALFRSPSIPAVIRIGDASLTKQDVELYERVARVKSPSISQASALNQLVSSFTRLQILKNVGVSFDTKTLEKEETRIRPLIENGGGLSRVREVFGEDAGAFRRLYVLPSLADRSLYQEGFQRSSAQREARQRAERFLEAFKREPEAVRRLAEGEKLPVFRLAVSRATGLEWSELGADSDRKLASKRMTPMRGLRSTDGEIWHRRVLAGMERGEVRESLQEFGEYWLAMRLLGPDRGDPQTVVLEVVKLPQASYEAWYRQQSAKVAVKKY